MALSEFQLIDRYFQALGPWRADTLVGVGDDAAIVEMPADADIVAVTAMLLLDLDQPAHGVASQLGASLLTQLPDPSYQLQWVLLALTLQQGADSYVAAFAKEFDAWLRDHQVQLIGGDTTRGPSSAELQGVAVRRRT